jgi:hypothetical protein
VPASAIALRRAGGERVTGVVVGLDSGVGAERGGAVLGGVRADLREHRADSDPLSKAVALVLQDLRDALDDPGDLLFRVEVDELLQGPRVVPAALFESGARHA